MVFVLAVIISGQSLSVHGILVQTVANLCFVLLILSVALLYFFIRYKSISTFITRQFGLGDALMLLAVCPLLPLPNFILFLCLSNILILLVELIKRLLRPGSDKTIPYAGYLSLFLTVWTLSTFFIPNINFRSDFTVYFLFSATP